MRTPGNLRPALAARLRSMLARLRSVLGDKLGDELGAMYRQRYWPHWPPGLPAPLTVGGALGAVEAGCELVAEALACDIEAAVEALVDPDAREAVLARTDLAERWCLRRPPPDADAVGASHGAEVALGLLLDCAYAGPFWRGEAMPITEVGGMVWPDATLAAHDVASWAAPKLDRAWVGREDESRVWIRRKIRMPEWWPPWMHIEAATPGAALRQQLEQGGVWRSVTVPRRDGLASELPPGSLAVLYLAERAALKPLALERAARLAVASWATAVPADAHHAAAEAALVKLAARVAVLRADALRLLATELCDACRELAAHVSTAGEAGEAPVGMLPLDAVFLAWLDKLDKGAADKLRAKACERLASYRRGELDAHGLFELWADGGAHLLENIARTLWRLRVKDQWEWLRRNRPSIVRAVMADRLLPAMTRQIVLPGLDDGTIRARDGRPLGKIATTDAATVDAVRRGLDLLGTVPGHRLVRFLVHAVHDQVQRGLADARSVTLAGGWSGLAEAIRYQKRDFEALELLLRAGHHVEWSHPGGRVGGLWIWADYLRGNATRLGVLRIVVCDALAPGLAVQLSQNKDSSLIARTARRLVPELRAEPPVLAVNERLHGPAWTLHRLALVELVDRAEELHAHGMIEINAARWRRLATEAKLPADKLPRLLDSWRTGDAHAPPLLVEPEPGRFTLADPHAAERDFIAEGGRRRTEGREAGRKGKQRKGHP